MADSDDIQEDDEIDYYGVLNVRKQATEEELRSAYRRMCVIYHPDKHQEPAKKTAAVQLFSKVQRAYDVLSNPETKAIYDIYGQKGLDAGWEVVERKRTPAEIQAEYEQLQREREERRLQQRTNPKGSISIGVDATDLFDNFDVFEERTFPNIEINNMSIMQSIEAPLTKKDTATMSGSLSIKNGNGSGDISASIRRVLSYKAWGEVEFGAGNGPSLALRGFRNLTKRSYGTSELHLQLRGNLLQFGIQTMVSRQLGKHTNGYLTWRAGTNSCMNSSVIRETESSRAMLIFQLGIPNTFAMASYTLKFEDTRLKGAIKTGVFGTIFEYGAERKISKHSHLGASVNIGVPLGVLLKIKLIRSTQVYSFRISLSEEISPSAMLYGTVVPLILYWAVKVLVVSPFLKQEKEKEAELNREKSEREMAEKKREAQDCVELMKSTYERIVEFERSRHGLIIISAWYGNLVSMNTSDHSSNSGHPEVIDVTVPVQCQVKDSRLFLTDKHKYNLSGFYDPCSGEEKLLRIRYEFRDVLHEVTVGDEEPVKLPKQSHKIEFS
ncbi:dnaJ homolog subfamily C member 11 [Exaiptasia diaphana]|uniref:J domain-containing protein n=1 Tax=Exaiptasia diaphana TaxID=2652724 RepID=A0A913YB17_EXADI|nr:dnaJ homolog subfamily C member 11 [Exaiptasia diaphana]KXJ21318.1 DnaJ-like subfamily C member 11 [Exaiptasia diaphana]